MTFSPERIAKLRSNGYCEKMIEHANTTEPHEGYVRVAWLRQHHHSCRDCANANAFKAVEFNIAVRIGASDAWQMGEEIKNFPGYAEAEKTEIERALSIGLLRPEMLPWAEVVHSRHPWPPQ